MHLIAKGPIIVPSSSIDQQRNNCRRQPQPLTGMWISRAFV